MPSQESEGVMKTIALNSPRTQAETDVLSQMFRLRARVFRDRLNWNVSVVGGQERDEFDELGPTYILVLGNAHDVVGSARLLPAVGPTMLEKAFPFLLTNGKLEAHHRMVESSRFCVDTQILGTSRGLLNEATLYLFAGIIEWSVSQGYDEIVTATDLRFERLLRHAGWPMQRLGEPRLIDQVVSVAGILPADEQSLKKVRPTGYRLSTGPISTHFSTGQAHQARFPGDY